MRALAPCAQNLQYGGRGAEFTFRDRQVATPCFYSRKNKDQLQKGKLRVAFEGNISALPHLLIR